MISVKTWTAGDVFGQSTPIEIVTKDVVPLPPSNLHIEETYQNGFLVNWCAPNQGIATARSIFPLFFQNYLKSDGFSKLLF